MGVALSTSKERGPCTAMSAHSSLALCSSTRWRAMPEAAHFMCEKSLSMLEAFTTTSARSSASRVTSKSSTTPPLSWHMVVYSTPSGGSLEQSLVTT
jgi:hypothetical protein